MLTAVFFTRVSKHLCQQPRFAVFFNFDVHFVAPCQSYPNGPRS